METPLNTVHYISILWALFLKLWLLYTWACTYPGYFSVHLCQLCVRVEAEPVFLLVLGHLAQRLIHRRLPERKLYVSGKFLVKSHVLSLCIASYSTLAYDSLVVQSSCVRECSPNFMNCWVILHFKTQPATLIQPSWNFVEEQRRKHRLLTAKALTVSQSECPECLRSATVCIKLGRWWIHISYVLAVV